MQSMLLSLSKNSDIPVSTLKELQKKHNDLFDEFQKLALQQKGSQKVAPRRKHIDWDYDHRRYKLRVEKSLPNRDELQKIHQSGNFNRFVQLLNGGKMVTFQILL